MVTKGKAHSQAILLLAYGSPEKFADIEAYYTDVRRGNPPDGTALKILQDRYKAIGGKTPLLRITQEQARLLQVRLGVKTIVGMKHWHPYITEAVEQIAHANIHNIIAIVLAPHFSAMSIGDYGARVNRAIAERDPKMHLTLIQHWGDNPLFIASLCRRITTTIAEFPIPQLKATEVVFTAHSLPIKILETGDPYQKELMQTCRMAAEKLKIPHWRMAFQSAGRTHDAWLGPDILNQLQAIAKTKNHQVLVAPIGFTTDNLEILYDLDIQAAGVANELDLTFKRIPSANVTPPFIDTLVNVITPFISPQHS